MITFAGMAELLDKEKSYTLIDGTVIFVRLQTRDDVQYMKEAFNKLSNTSKRLRYFSIAKAISDKDWEHYLDTDNSSRVAIVAYKRINDEVYGLAVARYFRTPDNPEVAEAGITVIDEYQHKGIGKILLDHLSEHARQNGINYFRAEIQESNSNILNMMKNLPHSTKRIEDNILLLEYKI